MRWLFRALAAIGLLAVVSGCGSRPVVGVFLPMSGPAALYGESIDSGIRMALNGARRKGEVPENLLVEFLDTKSDPQEAVKAVKKLVKEKGACVLVGAATSAEAEAVVGILDQLRVPCISPSASAPGLAKKSQYFFRIYPSDELEGALAGKFLADKLKCPTAILVSAGSEYAKGVVSEFEKAYAGKLVAKVSLASQNWREQLAEALKSKPAGAYVVGYADEILEVVRELKGKGFRGTILTTSAFNTTRVLKKAGDVAEGVLMLLPPFDPGSEKEEIRAFVEEYLNSFHRKPDVFVAHGYDAMRVALAAIKMADSARPEDVYKAIRYEEFSGITGAIKFDDYGEVNHYPQLFLVKGGDVILRDRYLEELKTRIFADVKEIMHRGGK